MTRGSLHRLLAGAAVGATLLGLPALAGAASDTSGDAFAGVADRATTASALQALGTPPMATAAASGPAVHVGESCLVAGRKSLALTTTGWAPGAPLSFWLGNTRIGTRTASAGGRVRTRASRLRVPKLRTRRTVVTRRLRVRDRAGNVAGPVRVKVVRRAVALPASARPGRRVLYRASGFPQGRRLYLHVRRRHRTLATIALGRPRGACGMLHTRLRYLPLDDPRPGSYEYWFTGTRRFRAAKTLYGLLVRF